MGQENDYLANVSDADGEDVTEEATFELFFFSGMKWYLQAGKMGKNHSRESWDRTPYVISSNFVHVKEPSI